MEVRHKVFGIGIVKSILESRIIIAFKQEEKTFKFPQAFEQYLTTNDPELLKLIDAAQKKNLKETQTDNKLTSYSGNLNTTPHYMRQTHYSSGNPLVGERAQTIPINTKKELFEIIGYMATPGRISSIEAEVPKDGRDKIFENLFPGQKYRPIEVGGTPSGLPNKLGPQFRINFGNLRNCPLILKENMGKGNAACVGRINKSKFVIEIVQKYGFRFGEYQNVDIIRKIAIQQGYKDSFERGYAR